MYYKYVLTDGMESLPSPQLLDSDKSGYVSWKDCRVGFGWVEVRYIPTEYTKYCTYGRWGVIRLFTAHHITYTEL